MRPQSGDRLPPVHPRTRWWRRQASFRWSNDVWPRQFACWPSRALPEDDLLREVADKEALTRLSTVTRLKRIGENVWRAVGSTPPIEPILTQPDPPWEPPPFIFSLDIDTALPPAASDEQRRDAACHHLAALPQCTACVWTDRSATGGMTNGGAGALIEWPDGDEREVRAPAGSICSIYRVEMLALHSALSRLLENPAHIEDPIVVYNDSQSAMASL